MDPTSIGLLVAEGSALAAIAAAYSLGRPQSKDSTSTPAPVVQTVGNTSVSSVVQTVPTATTASPTATTASPTATTASPTATTTSPTATAALPVSRTLSPELEQAITTVFRTQSTFKPTIEPANLARRLFIGDSVEPRQFEFAFHPDRCDPGSVIQLNNEYSKTLCDFIFTSAERVDGNYKFKDLENARTEFIKIVPTITATPATPTVTTATPTVTTATPTVTTATPALLDNEVTATPSSPINAPPLDESISFPEPEQTLNLPSTSTDTLEIPPDLQEKLNAAREKFETLKTKIADEEKKPDSPFAKSVSKQKRAEAAATAYVSRNRAAVSRQRNKEIAARNAENEKAALDFERKTANEARDERARKRAGIVSDPATVESILQTTEDSTNEAADSLKALEQERPASVSQNWFMDIENELEMYFDYYNQVEADLAIVPPPKAPDILTYADEVIKKGKEGLEKSRKKKEEVMNRLETIKKNPIGGRRRTPKKYKKTKTRKLTFRRTRKH